MSALIKLPGGKIRCISNNQESIHILQLKEHIFELEGIPIKEQTIVQSCKVLSNETIISITPFVVLDLQLPLLGGKGGFGALLRGAGAKLGQKKTTNFDDCRDLNGRRIKHVKAEKELLEWAKNKSENKEEEKTQEKKSQKEEEDEYSKKYKFDDINYMKSLKEIGASVSNSVETGLLRSRSSNNSTLDQEVNEPPSKKRRKNVWSGMEDFFEVEGESETKNKQKNDNGNEHASPQSDLNSSSNIQMNESNNVQKIESENKEKESIITPPKQNSLEDNYKEIQEIVEPFNSAVELESIGLDKLKEYLGKLGMKSGGTLKERTERLFKVKGTPFSNLDKILFVKAKK